MIDFDLITQILPAFGDAALRTLLLVAVATFVLSKFWAFKA